MTPRYLVPEWEEQSAILLAWPYAAGDFSPWLSQVEETYARIAVEVSQRETLLVLCRDEAHRRHIFEQLLAYSATLGSIGLMIQAYDDVWVRDTAPLSAMTPTGIRLIDFRFNGWGQKYPHDADAQLAQNLYASGVFEDIPLEKMDMVLEGGSIESDGQGTLLTTRRCLLNPNRNPHLSREQIEEQLSISIGVERVLWLDHGHAEGDDTDAHIDTLARFCSPYTIAYTACTRPEDTLFGELQAMAKQLETFTSISGNSYRLVPLPIPNPIYSEEGNRLPATYANFLIINGAVLVPIYDDPADTVALQRLSDCFPDREILGIPCTALTRQFGSLHCMTMQFPKSVPLRISSYEV
jgi:agmatine/peptidylarginine deiminase